MVRKRIFPVLLGSLLILLSPSPVLADIYIQSNFEKFLLSFFGSLVIVTLVNMIFEALILFILGLRKRRQILSVLVANLISWPVFYYESSATNQILMIIFYEILVILFETVFIYILNKEIQLHKLLIKILIANLLSATVGTYILSVSVSAALFMLYSLPEIFMKRLFFLRLNH